MKNIAIIEDDPTIGNMVEEILLHAGYRVLRAYSGTEALLLLSSSQPDLILLDLMLPGLSGEDVLGHIHGIPVIVLSAKFDVNDKVRLLRDGACDYITKPFAPSELLARIHAQLRAASGQNGAAPLCWRDIEMTDQTHQVRAAGQEIHLTRTEYALLRQLLQNQEQVLTKSHLLDLIACETPDCTESTLKVHISNLRIKLRSATGRNDIESVWGIGFKLGNG